MYDDETPKSRQPRERSDRTTSCTSCRGLVKVRRPSRSGEHYCAKADCQAAKQRSYRERRSADKARLDEMNIAVKEGDMLTIVNRVAHGESPSRDVREAYILEALFLVRAGRQPCASCGREDAVAGLPHPTTDLEGLCRELQLATPPPGLAGPTTFAIWPEMLPVVEAKLAAERAAAGGAA